MDARAAQARKLHREARERQQGAESLRQQRDRIIRDLRAEGWTYKRLAGAVGCSPELVAKILRGGGEADRG